MKATKTVEITKLENKVLDHLASKMYAEPGFTDVNINDILEGFDLSAKQLRGVLSSLVKKSLIIVWDDSETNCMTVDRKGNLKPTAEDKRERTFYCMSPSVFHLVGIKEWKEAGYKEAVELVVKGQKPESKKTETPEFIEEPKKVKKTKSPKKLEEKVEEIETPESIEEQDATKVCRDCGEEFPLDNFYKLKIAKDGHHVRCKKCYNILREEKKIKRELAKKEEEK